MVLCCLHPSFSKRPAGERDLRLSAKVGWGGSQPFSCPSILKEYQSLPLPMNALELVRRQTKRQEALKTAQKVTLVYRGNAYIKTIAS